MSSRPPGPGLLLLLLSLLAACSDDGADPDATAVTSQPPVTAGPPGLAETSSDATSEVEAEVEAAYLAYWEMVDRLGQAPDPEDPEIPERSTGQAAQEARDGLADMATQGYAVRHGQDYGHEVLSVEIDASGDEAIVMACTVDDSEIVEVATGEVSPREIATGLLEASMLHSNERWRVETVEPNQSWPGVGDCEAEL